MKLLSGLAVLTMALLISAVAAYFSVVGLAALFAAAFWPVIVMGSALETGKIVAATWLHANWHNPKVNFVHKSYLSIAVGVLMAITALGIYGYLAKGHLEQEAPLAGMELQIARIDQQIKQTREERQRLEVRLTQLDRSVDTIIGTAKTTRDTQAALKAREQQRKERGDIAKEMASKDVEINRLTDTLVPLKLKVSDVSAKLGPVKYVAGLFGWQDPSTAVQMIIAMIMFAFDPLALTLVLSAAITLSDWSDARARRKEARQPEIKLVLDESKPPLDFNQVYETEQRAILAAREQTAKELAAKYAEEPLTPLAEPEEATSLLDILSNLPPEFSEMMDELERERKAEENFVEMFRSLRGNLPTEMATKITYDMGGFDMREPLRVATPYAEVSHAVDLPKPNFIKEIVEAQKRAIGPDYGIREIDPSLALEAGSPMAISVSTAEQTPIELPEVETNQPLTSDKEHILALLAKHPEFVEEMINAVKESTDAANAAMVADTIDPVSTEVSTGPRVWIDQKTNPQSK